MQHHNSPISPQVCHRVMCHTAACTNVCALRKKHKVDHIHGKLLQVVSWDLKRKETTLFYNLRVRFCRRTAQGKSQLTKKLVPHIKRETGFVTTSRVYKAGSYFHIQLHSSETIFTYDWVAQNTRTGAGITRHLENHTILYTEMKSRDTTANKTSSSYAEKQRLHLPSGSFLFSVEQDSDVLTWRGQH